MDSTISPDPGTGDESEGDIAVQLDTLNIDGTNPETGDQVELSVKGSISKIVDGTAWVTPETVNDQPMPQEAPPADERENLMQQAGMADMSGGAY